MTKHDIYEIKVQNIVWQKKAEVINSAVITTLCCKAEKHYGGDHIIPFYTYGVCTVVDVA